MFVPPLHQIHMLKTNLPTCLYMESSYKKVIKVKWGIRVGPWYDMINTL